MTEDDRLYFVEKSIKEIISFYTVDERIIKERTPYQLVEIYKLKGFGKSLFLNSALQSTEYDEYIYHEGLVQPAMFAHPEPKSVFIGGGAEGATLREVLRHKEVENVTMIEIDKREWEICNQFLPEFSQGKFSDERVNLIFDDAKTILDREEKYDVIIFDLLDPAPLTPSEDMYKIPFLKKLKKKLKPGGIFVTQAGSIYLSTGKFFFSIWKHLSSVYSNVVAYELHIPSFQLPWGIIIASDKQNLFTPKRTDVRGLKFYSTDYHSSLLNSYLHLKNELDFRKSD